MADALSLPGWIYHDPEFFRVEMERVIRPAWQIVCHQNDIGAVGDWRSLDLLGESLFAIRGQDGAVRAFANVCRHRGSRLLDGQGGCAKRLTCPYHAWTYGTDGRLLAVPNRQDYRDLRLEDWGLTPVETEIWNGFVFVRLDSGGPSVAEMMAPHEAEVAPYRMEEMRALGRITLRPRAVNWKNVADNYSDGLHIAVAHPGLTRLFGGDYRIEAGEHVDRMSGDLVEQPSRNVSERAYQQLLPVAEHLPEALRRRWLYFRLWPNVAIDIYPDQIDFMHFVPVSATETMIREVSYGLPDNRREMGAARYLNWRVNRRVNEEDSALIARVQQGMAGRFYSPGPLGESEVCLRGFARRLRTLIPEAKLDRPPAPGWSGLPAA